MIFHVAPPLVIAFAVNPRIVVTYGIAKSKNILNHELNPMNGAHFAGFLLLKFHKSSGLRS